MRLRVGDDAGVHLRRRGGEGKGGAVEVGDGVAFGEPVKVWMDFVGRPRFEADKAHMGAGVEGGRGLAPADGSAADDDRETVR